MEKARKGLRAELMLKQKHGSMHGPLLLLKRERTLTDEERLNLSPEIGGFLNTLKHSLIRVQKVGRVPSCCWTYMRTSADKFMSAT